MAGAGGVRVDEVRVSLLGVKCGGSVAWAVWVEKSPCINYQTPLRTTPPSHNSQQLTTRTCMPVGKISALQIPISHLVIPSNTITMATQFLVRTPGNKHAINLKTILHDEIELIRIDEDGMAIFELPAADVVVELVVRRHNSSCQPLLQSPAMSSGALEPAVEAKTASTTLKDASLADGPLKRPNVTAQAVRALLFFIIYTLCLFVQSNEW